MLYLPIPCRKSMDIRFINSVLVPASVSNLEHFILDTPEIKLWDMDIYTMFVLTKLANVALYAIRVDICIMAKMTTLIPI